MTIDTTKKSKGTPFGMSINASADSAVPWDNFDRFSVSKSGKGTLYNTIGINYQVSNLKVWKTCDGTFSPQ